MIDPTTDDRRGPASGSGSAETAQVPSTGTEAAQASGDRAEAAQASTDHAETAEVAARHRRHARAGVLRRLSLQALTLGLVLLGWWAITAAGWVRPLYLPSPTAVWDAFVRANSCYPASGASDRVLCGEQGYFMWEHLLASFRRIGVGVGAAVLLGPIVGFLLGTVRWLNVVTEPYLNFLRALPPLGYIGLLIVWFGIGDLSKYWLLFLAAFPPIAIATINGIRGIRSDRIHAAQSMGAGRWQIATSVVLPSALPDLLNGVRIAAGFAWTTVVAAELNNGIPGIGGLAYVSGTQLQTALTIACIIVIGLSAVALDTALKYLTRALVPWQGKAT
ncbi:ABC transporter permease [Georgenia sp. 10Sc9-8]|uniref:ABC transporter permease n=1 Tax=Georgenia halotolerans TaxID=3028317 RepID=A0ABT5TWX1_9MICO|nr:ABC transporter permease [Georgenia halotolerans]